MSGARKIRRKNLSEATDSFAAQRIEVRSSSQLRQGQTGQTGGIFSLWIGCQSIHPSIGHIHNPPPPIDNLLCILLHFMQGDAGTRDIRTEFEAFTTTRSCRPAVALKSSRINSHHLGLPRLSKLKGTRLEMKPAMASLETPEHPLIRRIYGTGYPLSGSRSPVKPKRTGPLV